MQKSSKNTVRDIAKGAAVGAAGIVVGSYLTGCGNDDQTRGKMPYGMDPMMSGLSVTPKFDLGNPSTYTGSVLNFELTWTAGADSTDQNAMLTVYDLSPVQTDSLISGFSRHASVSLPLPDIDRYARLGSGQTVKFGRSAGVAYQADGTPVLRMSAEDALETLQFSDPIYNYPKAITKQRPGRTVPGTRNSNPPFVPPKTKHRHPASRRTPTTTI
ncbi:hypothetical protein ACFLQN_03595 [Candidatus Aenigmatarchaeota archaeon]